MTKIKNQKRVKLEKEIKIRNVVTTADLGQKVNIERLNNFSWAIYDQVSYGGICGYVKPPEMHGKVTIFSTGKMISVGSSSIEESIKNINITKFYLIQHGFIQDTKLIPNVRNIIATTDLSTKLNLKKLSKNLENSIYEPELFPALRYRVKKGLTVLIFSSGKIVITGGKSIEELNILYLHLKKSLQKDI